MSNSQYVVRNQSFGFCPHAVLAAPLSPLAASASITGYSSSTQNGIKVGGAALIGDELVVVTAFNGSSLTIGRGCCDTVPAAHEAGVSVWFLDESISTDGTEYAATAVVSVKLLPRTLTGGYVPTAAAIPKQVNFNFRFARPYPPGRVLVNGLPFTTECVLDDANPNLHLSWAHRNRVTQQDQLVAHSEGDITPEVGTTYRIDVLDADGETVLRSITGIESGPWTYAWNSAAADVGYSPGVRTGFIRLSSERGGFQSRSNYTIPFEFEGRGPQSPGGPDAYWPQTKMLLKGNGANGGLVFTDSSSLGLTVNAVGQVGAIFTSTESPRSGSACISSVGVAGAKLQVTNSALAIAGSFTFDGFIRITDNNTSGYLFNFGAEQQGRIYCQVLAASRSFRVNAWGDSDYPTFTYPANGAWMHFAFVYEAAQSRISIYADGGLLGTATDSTWYAGTMGPGGTLTLFDSLAIDVDDWRFTHTARWTSPFTPPLPPFSAYGP